MNEDRKSLRAAAVALTVLLAIASGATAQEATSEPDTVTGYVVEVRDAEVVLSNIPTMVRGPDGEVWLRDPAAAGESAEEGKDEGAQRFVFRRLPQDPGSAAAAEVEGDEESSAADSEKEDGAEGEDSEGEEEGQEPGAGAEEAESGDADKVVTFQGPDGQMQEVDPEKVEMRFSPMSGDASLTPRSDEPLTLTVLRLEGDVEGHELLVPGSRVRIHVREDGTEKIVSRIERAGS